MVETDVNLYTSGKATRGIDPFPLLKRWGGARVPFKKKIRGRRKSHGCIEQ